MLFVVLTHLWVDRCLNLFALTFFRVIAIAKWEDLDGKWKMETCHGHQGLVGKLLGTLVNHTREIGAFIAVESVRWHFGSVSSHQKNSERIQSVYLFLACKNMLNDEEKGSVGSIPSSSDLFSLVTEADMSHQPSSSMHNESNESASSASSSADGSGAFQGGTLILEGEEQTNSKRSENTYSDNEEKFTVSESVFLPSEVGTLEGHESCTSNNEQENSEQESEKNESTSNSTSNSGHEQKHGYSFTPKQLVAHGVATFVVVFGMLMLTTWRSLVWRSEALHLKEALRLQMQHHSSLNTKIASLEADLATWNRRHEDPHKWKFEKGHWEIDDEDDNTVLSFKNCYIEASLALGQCSKKWQDWIFGQGENSDDYTTDEDGFTDDMTRLLDGLVDGVTAASSSSFSFVEKTLKQMSQLYYFGDYFNSSDAESWNASEISKAVSNAMKMAESAEDEATTFMI